MNSALSTFLKRHAVTWYFVLAYVISWAFEIPLAASGQGWLPFHIPLAVHYLASFGPMLAALIITGLTEGSGDIRKLLSGLMKWRVKPDWFLFPA